MADRKASPVTALQHRIRALHPEVPEHVTPAGCGWPLPGPGSADQLEYLLHHAAHAVAEARGLGDTRQHGQAYRDVAAELGNDCAGSFGLPDATAQYRAELAECEAAAVVGRYAARLRANPGMAEGEG